jgi:3-dehydroquinate synthase
MIKRNLILEQALSSPVTHVTMGHGFLREPTFLEFFKQLNRQLVMIADLQVVSSIAESWVAWLNQRGIPVTLLTFPPGERSKTREMKAHLEDQLFEHRCGKQTVLIAVGGGVTTDLVGYLASTFCRGIPFISIPTSLLAMVDAAIGGKTAVNTPYGKNLIGSFYPPSHLLLDTALLSSLPEREWKNGIAEVIKYALIDSPSLFEYLLSHHSEWKTHDPLFLQTIIEKSVQIKKTVVKADYQETGYRRILNFGHTVAHAVEQTSDYAISHGEAVSQGMRVESFLSYRLGYLDQKVYDLILQLLDLYNFTISPYLQLTAGRLIEAMQFDKKSQGGKPRFVLLNAVGSPLPFEGAYCTSVDESLLREAIDSILVQPRELL